MAVVEDAVGRAPQTVAEATHDLYRQYGKQIYAYCLHQLRSREEAEDAVQTTFLNAFRGLQRGTTTRFEQAWLYKIAQNVCIARRSSTGRRLRLESPDDFEILQEVVPSSASAEGDTLELMGLDAALDSMPENQRRAILMREWQGMSYREVATELGLTQGAVEMLIFRARRTLAHALEQPAAEKRHASKARTGFSFGSLIAAMKPLFSSAAALKMAAVAVSAAVVSTNGVVHSVISHAAKPAKKRTVATAHVQAGSVRTSSTAEPVERVATHHTAITTPPVWRQTPPSTRRPVIPEEVGPAAPSDAAPPPAQAPEQTASQTTAPPIHTSAPAPQQTAAPAASVPSTPARPATPATPAQPPHDPGAPPADPTESQTTPPGEQTRDARGGKHRGEKKWNTWNLPQQSSDDTTTTTTTTTTTSTTATTTPAPVSPDPIVSPTPVSPDPVAVPVTTTSTPPSDPPPTEQPQPTPPPSPVTIWRGDGGHDSRGDGGGRHGHR